MQVLSGALALDDRNGSGSQLQQQQANLELLTSQQQIVSITADPQIVIAPDDKSIISGYGEKQRSIESKRNNED